MNKIVRTLTMAGLGLLAGASLGAPALAADSSTKTAGKSSSAQAQQGWDRTYIAGYYRTLTGCKKAGAVGDWVGKWDNPRCYPIRVGFRRGLWVLKVEKQWRHGGHFNGRDRGHFIVGGLRDDFRGGHHKFDGRGGGKGFGNGFGGHGQGQGGGDYRGGNR